MNHNLAKKMPIIRPLKSLEFSGRSMGKLVQAVIEKGGHATFKAKGDSMFPSIRNGDTITIAAYRGRAPKVGDVVAYFNKTDKRLVIHRIVKLSKFFFICKGDFCFKNDGPQPKNNIIGYLSGREKKLKLSIIIVFLSRVGFLPIAMRILKKIGTFHTNERCQKNAFF